MTFSWDSFLFLVVTLAVVCTLGGLAGRFLAPRVPRKWAKYKILLPAAVVVAILHANLFHYVFHVGTDYTNHYFFFWWPLFHGICKFHEQKPTQPVTLSNGQSV